MVATRAALSFAALALLGPAAVAQRPLMPGEAESMHRQMEVVANAQREMNEKLAAPARQISENMEAMRKYREAQDAAWERAHPGKTRGQVAEENKANRLARLDSTTGTLMLINALAIGGAVAGIFAYRRLTRNWGQTDPAALAASDPWVQRQLAQGKTLPPAG